MSIPCLSIAICPVLEYCLAKICLYHKNPTSPSPRTTGTKILRKNFLRPSLFNHLLNIQINRSSITQAHHAALEKVMRILTP